MMSPRAPLFPAWRWFGPADPIPLAHIRQTGARGIVTALHDVPPGVAWSVEAVLARRDAIAQAGLAWSVVESIPVSDAIKTGGPERAAHVAAWARSLRAVARAGVRVVCYNFMPVLDWTRTDLAWRHPNGAAALRFDAVSLAAFDLCALERPGAEADAGPDLAEAARRRWRALDEAARAALAHAILSGLPGSDRGYTTDEFRDKLALYAEVDATRLRDNLVSFLAQVAPVAEEVGVRLAIHPDDPPVPLFGLPRVVSVAEDFAHLFAAVPSPANGMTLCAGSLGARADNDCAAIAERFAERIHFAHLRNVTREADGSFHESEHLAGSVPMAPLVARLMAENARRIAGGADAIPFRPDHGHVIGPDAAGVFNPGYTFAGRLRGLGELVGLMTGLARAAAQD